MKFIFDGLKVKKFIYGFVVFGHKLDLIWYLITSVFESFRLDKGSPAFEGAQNSILICICQKKAFLLLLTLQQTIISDIELLYQ